MSKIKILVLISMSFVLAGCGSLSVEQEKTTTLSPEQEQGAHEEEMQALEQAPVFELKATELDERLRAIPLFEATESGVRAFDSLIEIEYAAGEKSRLVSFTAIYLQINRKFSGFGGKQEPIEEAITSLFEALEVSFVYSSLEADLASQKMDKTVYDQKVTVEITQNNDKEDNVQLIIKPL